MRLAIFGGTFDPIHKAHLIVAEEAADQFHLDRVLFIPAAHPPHKSGTHTPYEHRYRMVELACNADPRFVASRLEEGSQRSYSYHTIERVKASLAPGDELLFVIGADAFAEIRTWFRADDVLRMVTFLVVTRPGHVYDVPEGARVVRLDTLALPVSSSEIRQTLAAGEDSPYLTPEVAAYIHRNCLYRSVAR